MSQRHKDMACLAWCSDVYLGDGPEGASVQVSESSQGHLVISWVDADDTTGMIEVTTTQWAEALER